MCLTTVLTVIYKSHCIFIGRLFNVTSDSVAKRVTLQILFMIKDSNDSVSRHIISPVRLMWDSCKSLNLITELLSFIEQGGVQCTSSWKSRVKIHVNELETQMNHVKAVVYQSV